MWLFVFISLVVFQSHQRLIHSQKRASCIKSPAGLFACCHQADIRMDSHRLLRLDGCHNFSRTRANGKRSFVLNNLTSNKIRASRIATYEKSTKYCKVSFIYEVFKPYFFKKSCKQVSKIILVYVCVVFEAGFFLLLTNYGFISCVYFTKFKELPTLGN